MFTVPFTVGSIVSAYSFSKIYFLSQRNFKHRWLLAREKENSRNEYDYGDK